MGYAVYPGHMQIPIAEPEIPRLLDLPRKSG
jgi:hypothetical protein